MSEARVCSDCKQEMTQWCTVWEMADTLYVRFICMECSKNARYTEVVPTGGNDERSN